MAELDNELVEATDDLLNGRTSKPLSDDNRELMGVVRQLYQVIDPKNTPSAAFQQKLIARLNSEWDREYAPPKLRLVDRPVARVLALAAAIVLVLAAILVLAVPSSSNQLNGAAIGFGNGA